jgi:hypothetical protein
MLNVHHAKSGKYIQKVKNLLHNSTRKILKTIGLWKRCDINVQHTANWEYIRASKQRFINKIKTNTKFRVPHTYHVMIRS